MEKELLDFCRVKKIFDKGFGFLSSINHPQDVFFHFSKIKDEKVREELQKLKRGVVYIFYTSQAEKGKRKVSRMWLNLKNVPDYLIAEFKYKIIDELNDGKTNVFELAHIIKELKSIGHIQRKDFNLVLNTKKILSNPSVIEKMLNEEDLNKFEDINEYLINIRDQNIKNDIWSSEIINKIFD
ncbi:MAG: cold shock domain-containing protein [Melioribacteraceae bacterium]|nr:cold shock domain-containing protein [Melioribacteraceae bacterium]